MHRALRALLLAALAVFLAAAAWLAWFAARPLTLPASPFEFKVRSGASLQSVARELAAERVLPEPYGFRILGRVQGKAAAIQAGTYRIESGITPLALLDKLARGDVVVLSIRFVEGTTLRQWLARLAGDPDVRHTLDGRAEALPALLGIAESSAEGWLFPDTYRFTPGIADLEILRRAHAAMQHRLAAAWAGRDPDLPLAGPYEALILASIVEKETGLASERPLIASVFVNRLRLGMRLQTDPTVIYGMGERYDGNIRKRDLEADTPWNTYTRAGLPPTPIAMPGEQSLQAAVHPADSRYLYFVGRGDGSHAFSRTLEEHNRAVARYQLQRAGS